MKKNSVTEFNSYINELISSKNEKDNLKAQKIIPWIKIYTQYLKFEETFNPYKLPNYKKGDIIRVNFGFNVGNELGGVHFAVVLENKNKRTSGTLTVIPLSSLKKSDVCENGELKVSNYNVNIKNGVYDLMIKKIDKLLKKLDEESKKLKEELDFYEEEFEKVDSQIKNIKKANYKEEYDEIKSNIINISDKISELSEKLRISRAKYEGNAKEVEYANKLYNEVQKMKKGTKALVSQLTTISKLRIIEPKNNTSSLSEIRLTKEDMDTVENKIKELFLKSIDK
ncbi:type II toxin-antitoxin system PemK/MazF family toxin [Clostridium baratii]|uniref:type II toxin-antitoxin system PemK/MazF family toxin n=1 Tax=Clostridium baratii TaxID=1561 RepID=UPI003D348ACF